MKQQEDRNRKTNYSFVSIVRDYLSLWMRFTLLYKRGHVHQVLTP